MILPLDLLEEYQGDVYIMTCATIRRAHQIEMTGDEIVEQNGGKVVSTALEQILTKKVRYRLEE